MGRAQKRKQIKQQKHKTKNTELDTTIKISTTLKIIASVAIILLVLYYILAVFVTKEIDVSGNKDNSTSESANNTTNSVSNKILAVNTFNQKEETYYVYYYDFDDEDEEISSSINNLTDYTIYRVDTSNSLNKNYVTEDKTGNNQAKSLEELKVVNPTLIKVENDTIIDYYEGSNSVNNFLNK